MAVALLAYKKQFANSSELVWLMIALVISVTAITSVTFLSDRLQQSFSQKAREMIGADLIIRGDQQLDPAFTKQATESGLKTANTIIFSTMMRVEKDSKLVSLKAVSDSYPLRGSLTLQEPNTQLLPGQAWLDPQLMSIYRLRIGDEIALGEKRFVISNLILREPDRGAGFMNFAPRVMIHEQDLAQTQLLGLGSRASYRLLIATQDDIPIAQSEKLAQTYSQWSKMWIDDRQIRGVNMESLENGQPLLRRTIDQANRFLSLVALLTGMIAAVGISLASRRYAKKQIIATVVKKCFGAKSQQIIAAHLFLFLQIMVFAGLLGVALGYGLQEVLITIMQNLLDKNLPSPSFWPVIWGLLVALILLLGFALPPLLALTQVSPQVVMRKENIHLQRNYLITAALGIGSYFFLLLWIANNLRLSVLVLGGFIGACAIFAVSAYLLSKWIGKYFSNTNSSTPGLRYTAQRIAGNPSWMSFQMSALGIAMLAILLLIVIRFNVLHAWESTVPLTSNNRFILNVLPDQKDEVEKFLQQELRNPDFDSYPMIRGRLMAINQREIRGTDYADQNTQRLVEREFNLSYADRIPVKNQIIAGQWFDTTEPMQVSMEKGMMRSLRLKLGDELLFEVAGKSYRVKITSVRKLDWNSMRVNFFAMMPPQLLKDAPQSWIMAFRQEMDQRVDSDLINRFPNITSVNIQESISQAQDILKQLIFAIQVLFLFTLLAGFVVLMIALISVQEQRMSEVAILKTLGANQLFLTRVWLIELIMCGGVAGFLSGLFASFAGWYLSNYLLEIDMQFPYWTLLIGVLLGILINSLASFWLRIKTLHASPSMILKS
jgi:putative ABC transport system permease protein